MMFAIRELVFSTKAVFKSKVLGAEGGELVRHASHAYPTETICHVRDS